MGSKSLSRLTPFTAAFAAAVVTTAHSAPTVTSVDGNPTHNGTISIVGREFGTKESTPPVIWDNCEQPGLSSQWSGAWPDRGGSEYHTKCRAPIRNIPAPHSNTSMYIAGAHADSSGADAGYNVMLYKNRQINSYPAYTYASWYQRSDDNWQFCGDNNYKVYDFSMGTSPYTMPENWYIEYNARPASANSGAAWHLLDDAGGTSSSSLISPDAAGQSWWWNGAVNPMSGTWTKIEVQIRYTNQHDGYIKLWENGRLRIDYKGPTDRYAGRSRSEAIGGYARCYGYTSNWRYFADVYLDHTPARVVLANNSNLSQATVIEPQIPTAWSDTSITARVNLGRLSGSEMYAFVFDAAGNRNQTGIRVGSTVALPDAPKGLTAQ